jgi:hypothetical protein
MGEPSAAVRALIVAEPALADDRPQVFGWLQRLCRAAARSLPATGVAVSVFTDDGAPTMVAASSPDSEIIDELQFTVGEGPCLDVYATARPVLAPDLVESGRTLWPGYAPAAHEHGVRAVFAFPLQVGALRLGALDVYRDQVGLLSSRVTAQALTYADVATTSLLDAQAHSEAQDPPGLDDALSGRLELYQAQGMVMMQLRVDLNEAMVRLRAYAYAHNRPLSEVADDVVARRLTLEGDGS